MSIDFEDAIVIPLLIAAILTGAVALVVGGAFGCGALAAMLGASETVKAIVTIFAGLFLCIFSTCALLTWISE